MSERIHSRFHIDRRDVGTLSGMSGVHAQCRKIRDDQSYCQAVEQFIQEHSQAKVTYSICPDCAKELRPGLADKVLNKV